MKTYITALCADTANGIQVIDAMNYPDADWLYFCDFRDSLRTIDDDEEIFCMVEPDELEILQTEYGVKV